MKKMLLILGIMLMAAACGAAEEEVGDVTTAAPTATTASPTVLSEPVPLVVIAEVGGCYMLGPNCSTTVVMSDGSFGVYRNDPVDVLYVPSAAATADYTGSADVLALSRAIDAADFEELRRTLGPGECRACVDGVDYNVRFLTVGGPEDLSSSDYEFDSSVELFAELDVFIRASREAGTLEMLPRGS